MTRNAKRGLFAVAALAILFLLAGVYFVFGGTAIGR
jgi:hypothetical protein